MGNILIVAAIIFAIIEIQFFGANLFPKTITEFICDLLIFVIFAIGIILKINKENPKN